MASPTLDRHEEALSSTEAVIFDYGGTLVNFARQAMHLAAVRDAYAPRISDAAGITHSDARRMLDELGDCALDAAESGPGAVDYLDLYLQEWRTRGIRVREDLLYQVVSSEQRCCDRTVTLNAGAHEVLDHLRSLGIRTAICSNSVYPPELMDRQVSDLGLDSRLDAVVWSSAINARKPAREIFAHTLDSLQCAAAGSLFVGDSPTEDYRGAIDIGMRAVLYNGSTPGQHRHIPSVSNLIDVASCLNGTEGDGR